MEIDPAQLSSVTGGVNVSSVLQAVDKAVHVIEGPVHRFVLDPMGRLVRRSSTAASALDFAAAKYATLPPKVQVGLQYGLRAKLAVGGAIKGYGAYYLYNRWKHAES